MVLRNPEIEEPEQRPTHQVLDGRVRPLRKMTSDEFVKFMSKVELVDKGFKTLCWFWTGYKHERGYPCYHLDGDSCWAHRLSYVHFKGPIPESHIVDHRCEFTSCVNPDHLRTGTLSQNNLFSLWRKRDKVNLRLPFTKKWDKDEKVFYQKIKTS